MTPFFAAPGIDLLKYVLTSTYFYFNEISFEWRERIAMGSPLSSVMADFFKTCLPVYVFKKNCAKLHTELALSCQVLCKRSHTDIPLLLQSNCAPPRNHRRIVLFCLILPQQNVQMDQWRSPNKAVVVPPISKAN